MEVKEAVQAAKKYLDELFEGEGIMNIGLEEVMFDAFTHCWKITLGFSRPWDQKTGLVAAINNLQPGRSFKVVHINNDDGRAESLTDRVLPDPKS